MADIGSLPSVGQKPWNLNPAIQAINAELEGRLSDGAINARFGAFRVLPMPSGGDDTAALNAALAEYAGQRVCAPSGAEYTITAPLVVYSNTYLDMHGATVTAASASHPMIRNNKAVTTVGTPTTGTNPNRDQRITLTGGKWICGAGTGNQHRLFFHQVDGLQVTDLNVTSGAGKYAVMLADVTRFSVTDIDLAVYSDGVHVTGPASDGQIARIHGRTGDDFVALGCSDYLSYDYSRGTIQRVVVETLRPALDSASGNGLKLFTTDDALVTATPGDMLDITVRDLRGTVRSSGVVLLQGAGVGGRFDRITIDGIGVTTRGAYSQVFYNKLATSTGGSCGTIVCRGVTPTAAQETIASNGFRAFGGLVETLIIDGMTIRQTSGSSPVRGIYISNGASVTALIATAIRGDVSLQASGLLDITDNSSVTDARLEDVLWSGGRVVQTAGTATLSTLFLSGRYTGGADTALYLNSATTPNVTLDWRQHVGTAISLVHASSGVTLHGKLDVDHMNRGLYRGGSQVVSVRSLDVELSVARVTKQAGARAYNRDSSLSCGEGLVVCDGTNWKNLFTGATY